MKLRDPDLLRTRAFIGGKWLDAANGATHPVVNPATREPIGRTVDNLTAAIASETHEYTDMYTGMARAARREGFEEIADWFETLARAGKSHAARFRKALDAL